MKLKQVSIQTTYIHFWHLDVDTFTSETRFLKLLPAFG